MSAPSKWEKAAAPFVRMSACIPRFVATSNWIPGCNGLLPARQRAPNYRENHEVLERAALLAANQGLPEQQRGTWECLKLGPIGPNHQIHGGYSREFDKASSTLECADEAGSISSDESFFTLPTALSTFHAVIFSALYGRSRSIGGRSGSPGWSQSAARLWAFPFECRATITPFGATHHVYAVRASNN